MTNTSVNPADSSISTFDRKSNDWETLHGTPTRRKLNRPPGEGAGWYLRFQTGKPTIKQPGPLAWMLPTTLANDLKAAQYYAALPFKPKTPWGTVLPELTALVQSWSTNDEAIHQARSLVVLSAAQMLSSLSQVASYEQWHRCVETLLDWATNTLKGPCSEVVTQWLSVELPLTLCTVDPHCEELKSLSWRAQKSLEIQVSELLDLDGWPQAEILEDFGLLMASWTRSLWMLSAYEDTELDDEVDSQLEWAVSQFLRLERAEGGLMFSQSKPIVGVGGMLEFLPVLTHDKADHKLLKLREKRVSRSGAQKKRKQKLPSPSNLSEWGESAVLQSSWKFGAPKLGLKFSKQTMAIEVAHSRDLICGDWMPSLKADGRQLGPLPDSEFDVLCEMYDEDLDYLELEIYLEDGFRLNRQILLSRHDRFLMLADMFVGSHPETNEKLEYDCLLPLAPQTTVTLETETREVYLCQGPIQSLVLPLWLPEWKTERCAGEFSVADEGLKYSQMVQGAGLYVPLFFDLCPQRSVKKRTWRQLTVAEERQQVSPSVAAAFRVQLDKQQWVFYRAIAEQGNRTFFGENFNGEFIFNGFDRDGTVTSLIEIDD